MLSPTWALVVAVFAVGVDFNIVLGITPAISDDLNEPIAAVVLVTTAYALPTALLAPVFGPLSDRRGRRLALQVGFIIFVVSAAACVVAPGLPSLMLARAVNGLGAAIIFPAAFAYAGDMPDLQARSKALGVIASAVPLAVLLGLPIGAAIATLAGWRGVFVFITILGMVALVLVRVLLAPDKAKTERPLGYLASYRTVLGDRGALKLLAVTFVWFLMGGSAFTFIAEFIHVTYDVPAAQAGLIMVVGGAVGVVASRLSGRFMAAVGTRPAVLVGIITTSSAAVLMPLSTSALPLTVLVVALWVSGTWFALPAMQAIVAAHSERLRGTMLAFNSSALNLSLAIGPIIGGAILVAAGFPAAFWSAALFGVTAFGLAWVMLPRTEPA